MLPENIAEITEVELQNLVANRVPESRAIEYKLQTAGATEQERKEFLADVSSFANTNGGDLALGVREDGGFAAEILGIDVADIDAELLRLENIIRSGLQPRIEHAIRAVPLASGRLVIVIRIRRSLIGPHRVVLGGEGRFFGRGGAGKFSLDVEQLRTAFLQSATLNDKIRDFHQSRVMEIEAGRAPLPLQDENKIIIHLIPRETFLSNTRLSNEQLRQIYERHPELTEPMSAGGGWHRHIINLEGMVWHAGRNEGTARSYLQIFREGIIETVDVSILERDEHPIPSYALEHDIITHVRQCLQLLQHVGVNPPIYVFITLTNIKGRVLNVRDFEQRELVRPFQQNLLNLPSAVFEDYQQSVARTLRPSLEIVWNAGGIAASPNYNAQGEWIERH